MILNTFRISNFKSIRDSGKCIVSPKITTLAGKNESGKTNILNALEKLNDNSKFEDSDRALHIDVNGPMKVSFYFTLTPSEVSQLLKNSHIKADREQKEVIIEISDEYEGFEINGAFIKEIEKHFASKNKLHISNSKMLHKEINRLMKDYLPTELVWINPEKDLDEQLRNIPNIINQTSSIEDKRIKAKLHKTLEIYRDIIGILIDSNKKIEDIKGKIIETLPKVVLFDSFHDTLPSEVNVSEIKTEEVLETKHRIIKDFISLSGLQISDLEVQSRQKRTIATNRVSRVSSELFGKCWNQDPIEISVRHDEPILSFFVHDKDKEVPYKPEQRSKGLQWFMAFFLRLTAEGKEKNNILLIDEPGLYLHAKAQKDILSFLEQLSKENQIIFTTHSPYLIDPDKLSRVRLILKNDKTGETITENNFNKNADDDTLTPIITAIGLDLSQGISFSGKTNILLEGVSDYYYILGVLDYLKKNEKYKFSENHGFIPSIGHTKISTLLSLLIGWGFDYKIVLDRKGTNKTYNKLITDGIPENKIIFVSDKSNESIEQLFSDEDGEKLNLNDGDLSKSIKSKIFFEQITNNKIKLNKSTLDNFKILLEKLKANC